MLKKFERLAQEVLSCEEGVTKEQAKINKWAKMFSSEVGTWNTRILISLNVAGFESELWREEKR